MLGRQAPQETRYQIDEVVWIGDAGSLASQRLREAPDGGVIEATLDTFPSCSDRFLHRHDTVEISDEVAVCHARKVREVGSPTAARLLELLRIELDERADLNERPLAAASHDVAGLRGDHEAADFGLTSVHTLRGSFSRLAGQGSADIEAEEKPVLAEDAVSLAPGLHGLVDARAAGLISHVHAACSSRFELHDRDRRRGGPDREAHRPAVPVQVACEPPGPPPTAV